MGFFDSVKKGIGDFLGSAEKRGKLMGMAADLIADRESGGLEGLARRFKDRGLGEAVSSWIGTGQNQPVTADQVENAIGSEKIRQYAENLGLSSEDVSRGLAAVLPRIIDILTPDGKVPKQADVEQKVSGLKDKLSGE